MKLNRIMMTMAVTITVGLTACGNEVAPEVATTAQDIAQIQSLTAKEAREIAKEAYIFGASYVDNYRVYLETPIKENHFHDIKYNEFFHLSQLAGPGVPDTPNNDTLLSFTILDLRSEPVVISVPEVDEDRVYMLQLGAVSTETLPYISSIATGTEAGDYVIVGADYTGILLTDKFNGVIVNRGQFVAVTGRTAVSSLEDQVNVKAIQAEYNITPLSTFLGQTPPAPATPIDFIPWDDKRAEGLGFLDYINMTLAWELPTLAEVPMFARFARIGVVPGNPFTTEGLSKDIVTAIEAGLQDAKKAISIKETEFQTDAGGGWLFGTDDISRFGDNYLLRAAVSADTIYPNAPDHALYGIGRNDENGASLSGASKYTITFEGAELPPVDAFWSLTLYDAKTTAMTPNEINRYSIGDRTPDLVYNEDNSLTLCLQSTQPVEAHCNWLPTPEENDFYLIMRLYAPQITTIKNENWVPPAITHAK